MKTTKRLTIFGITCFIAGCNNSRLQATESQLTAQKELNATQGKRIDEMRAELEAERKKTEEMRKVLDDLKSASRKVILRPDEMGVQACERVGLQCENMPSGPTGNAGEYAMGSCASYYALLKAGDNCRSNGRDFDAEWHNTQGVTDTDRAVTSRKFCKDSRRSHYVTCVPAVPPAPNIDFLPPGRRPPDCSREQPRGCPLRQHRGSPASTRGPGCDDR